MTTSNDFKTGLTIQHDGNIYTVLEFQHVKPGKGAAFVRSKLRNLRSGAVIEKTWRAGEKVATAMIEKTKMQYLYASGDQHVFMNQETYEQLEINAKQIEYELNFLKETMEISIISFEQELLGVDLPEKVALVVSETVPGVRGNTVSNTTKDAVLETGLKLQVPLFINEGDEIIVNTHTGKYSTKA